MHCAQSATLSNMEAAPERPAFATDMLRRREALGLSANQAAIRSGISASRWLQVEKGYVRHGNTYQPTTPSRSHVIKIADALHWPRNEALALAGFDYTDNDQPATPELPASRIMSIWQQLTQQQREAIEWQMRLFLDPHAAYGSKPPATGNRPVFVPPAGESWSDARSKQS